MIKNSILVAALILFLFFSLFPSIVIPDPTLDHIGTANLAFLMLHNIQAHERDVHILGRYWTRSFYGGDHGALDVYMMLPFLFLTTIDKTAASRLPSIFTGVALIILVYYFCCKFFNSYIANLTVLFLSTNHIFLSELKNYGLFSLTMGFFTLASTMFLWEWVNKRNNKYIYLSMFFLGLGWNAKGWYIWFIVAFFINAIIYIRQHFMKIKAKALVVSFFLFLIGASPILSLYLGKDRSRLFWYLKSIFIKPTRAGIDNLYILENFLIRLKHFNYILSDNKIFVLFFWIIFLILLYLMFAKKIILRRDRVIFILSILIITFLMSIFTFTDYKQGHLLILFPYTQLIISIGLFEIGRFFKNKLTKPIFILIIGIMVVFNLKWCYAQYEQRKYTKENIAPCKIELLTDWLLENKIYKPIIMPFYLREFLRFYSDFKIDPGPFWGDPSISDVSEYSYLKDIILSNPDNFFIFQSPEEIKFVSVAQEIWADKKKIILEKKFCYSDGKLRFSIYSLK